VLVSVAPYRFLVEQIAGDTVNVQLMVPPMASAHTYEPTPKEIMAASRADVWFVIGEPFERRAVASLKGFRKQMRVVDLKKGLDLIYDDHRGCCHGEGGADLHFWLSPRLDKIQAETIANTLIEMYPKHADLYRDRLVKLKGKLDAVDQKIKEIVAGSKGKTVMVAHAAYGYFCREYDFKQLPIEYSGKDPTAKQLHGVIAEAKELGIDTIFVQKQYSNKGATLIAQQLGAKVVTLEPYDENVLESLVNIARQFAESSSASH
jgi:zinc transport system substrate-binding protein